MIKYVCSLIQKLIDFLYLSLYMIGGASLNDYAYLYPYWQGFDKINFFNVFIKCEVLRFLCVSIVYKWGACAHQRPLQFY
jgi:hypothetical protein